MSTGYLENSIIIQILFVLIHLLRSPDLHLLEFLFTLCVVHSSWFHTMISFNVYNILINVSHSEIKIFKYSYYAKYATWIMFLFSIYTNIYIGTLRKRQACGRFCRYKLMDGSGI